MHGGVAPCKMREFHDYIFPCTERKAEYNFIRNSGNCSLVLRNWNTCYWVRCWEDKSTFWDLACDSMNFVVNQVASIDRVETQHLPLLMLCRNSLCHCNKALHMSDALHGAKLLWLSFIVIHSPFAAFTLRRMWMHHTVRTNSAILVMIKCNSAATF